MNPSGEINVWAKVIGFSCVYKQTTNMAESAPLRGQYSPDQRNPYRTNEAFHFDPDEEEKLAQCLAGKRVIMEGW